MSNIADTYPARFLLVDNRTTFEVNLTLSFAGTTYTTFQYQGADYTSINVTQEETYTFWFVVPAANQPCLKNEDCLASYCEGNVFNLLIGCINNVCDYSPTSCSFFCDDVIGCYKSKTTRECNSTFDCESVCTGNYTAEIGLCASDGFCVLDRYTCDSPCENYEVVTVEGNKTIGMCPEIFSCYVLGAAGTVQRFLINVLYEGALESVKIVDVRFYCTLFNRGQKECISGTSVPLTVDVMNTIPDVWVYNTNASDYIFQDILVSCSAICNLTYEYCPYGCDSVVGACNREPTSPEGQGRNIIEMFKGWWYAFFPNIYERTIMWVIIAILIASLVEYGAGGKVGRGMGVMFGFVMMGMLLGGVFIDQVVFEVAFVFTVLAGLVVWRTWNQAKP